MNHSSFTKEARALAKMLNAVCDQMDMASADTAGEVLYAAKAYSETIRQIGIVLEKLSEFETVAK